MSKDLTMNQFGFQLCPNIRNQHMVTVRPKDMMRLKLTIILYRQYLTGSELLGVCNPKLTYIGIPKILKPVFNPKPTGILVSYGILRPILINRWMISKSSFCQISNPTCFFILSLIFRKLVF